MLDSALVLRSVTGRLRKPLPEFIVARGPVFYAALPNRKDEAFLND